MRSLPLVPSSFSPPDPLTCNLSELPFFRLNNDYLSFRPLYFFCIWLCVGQGQLAESHVEVAKQLQAEGSFKEAEKHFVEAGDWKGAVQMYRAEGMWEGSFRLAKAHGGALATKQVCDDSPKK